MAILKEISAVVGKYTDKEGKEKNQYVNMGKIIETKNGSMMKIDSIPVNWDGWAYLNDPRPRDNQQAAPQQQSAPASHIDNEDVPF